MKRFAIALCFLVALSISVDAGSLSLLGVGTHPTVAGHQVSLDSCGAEHHVVAATSPQTYTFTVASNSNRALVASIAFGGGLLSAISMHWDSTGTNQAMTQIIEADNAVNTGAALFGLVAPTTGTNLTMSVSWTGTAEVYLNVCSWFGVNQTGGATSFPNSASASNAQNVAITSASGDIVQAVGDGISNYAGVTGTQIYQDNGGTNINSFANYDNGAATVTIGASTAVNSIRIVGTDIKAN